MAEFVLNKTQRLTFDSSSPNGILLFREVSKVCLRAGVGQSGGVFGRSKASAGRQQGALVRSFAHLLPSPHKQVIVAYGSHALQLGPAADPYGQKYKVRAGD